MAVRQYPGGDKAFEDACMAADVKPTRRQWKKWQKKTGRAYAARGK